MKTYSQADLAEIRTMSPAGSVARVSQLRHFRGEKYTCDWTRTFKNMDEAISCAAELGAEIDLPEHYGTAAFSADGKIVRLLTIIEEAAK